MKKILITGGTAFVSKYAAEYFVKHGYEVYVLNRNTKPQIKGVHLIERDRHRLGNRLKEISFDIIADITAYHAEDIVALYNALGSFKQYIMISSSAVYSEDGVKPFVEEAKRAANKFWGKYGTDKIAAENALLERVSNAYVLRPPYLYGPMNNVYREAFVFDCARADRPFYLPKDGEMKLQFFHVNDLCKLIEILINTKPSDHIMNVGNERTISIKDWVTMCYACFHKTPSFVNVPGAVGQRNYFSFHDYEYCLDVRKQQKLLSETIPLDAGLRESAEWYLANETAVNKKPYFEYIDKNLVRQ